MGVESIAGIVGPTLAGWMYDTLNSYNPLWFGYIGLNLIAIVLILNIKPLEKAPIP